METKRLVLAFALSAAVLIGWTVLFPPPKPTAPAARPAATAPEVAPSATTAAPATQTSVPAPAAQAARESLVPVSAGAEELVEVRSPLYTARLSNEGGALKSFVLTHHRDGAGKALDLVRQGPPFPGATLTLDPADSFLARAQKAHFAVEREAGNGVTTVRFRYREASGEGLVRTYVFRDSYVVAV
ncbi:MAG: membrane protein insertase YidC, partial [Thermoanaerobaculia bacterium]